MRSTSPRVRIGRRASAIYCAALRAHKEKMAESARTPPFLPEHYYLRTKAARAATASERPSIGLDRARGNEPARIPLLYRGQHEVRLTKNPATNQRAKRRDRTNVCMCHLDHLLQLPWAHHRRVPPTEAARPKYVLKNDLDCDASKDFKVWGC
jgi:hypothetical protein